MKKLLRILVFTLVGAGLLTTSLAVVSYTLAPDPLAPQYAGEGAVVQVYGADVWGFRGYFAIHTWIATRKADEANFTIHQVVGWRLRRSGTALHVTQGRPDRPWFNSPAVLLHEVTGAEATRLLPRVRSAAEAYPFAREYTMWPGPNSNSFTEWVALEVPDLGLALPAKAIGASWMRSFHASR